MLEGSLSWKRAAYWPRYESGKNKGVLRDASLVIFAVILILCPIRAFGGGHWNNLLWPPAAYAVFGVLWWSVHMIRRAWDKLKSSYPKLAKIIDIITLITAWEVRLFLEEGNPPKWLRLWWYFIMATYMIGLYGWRGEFLTRTVGIGLMIAAEAMTDITGLYLAWKSWKKPMDETEPPRN